MNISNENRLLLYCTQTRIPKERLTQVGELVGRQLNWQNVLKSAYYQGIAPLLYRNLKDIRDIPSEVISALKKAYYWNMARNMYFYTELRRILEAFGEKDLGVIVLKGAALARSVYGDIALRPMGDIDLLVRKGDLDCAEQIMSALGYMTQLGNQSQEWYRQNHFHLSPYIAPNRPVIVEIHHHIIDHPLQIEIDKWWEKAKEIEVANCRMLIPSAEDMLFHLCLHLFNHGYNNYLLRGLCDISETLRYYKDEFNWTEFQTEVSRYGFNKLVYSILYLVNKLYRVDSRLTNLLMCFEAFIDLKLVSLIEKQIFTEEGASPSIPSPLVQCLAADKLGDKIRILFDRIFPTREVMSNRYSIPPSSRRVYFYYLARPYKLFLRYGKYIFEMCR